MAEDEANNVLFTVTPRDWATLKQGHPLSTYMVGAFVDAIDFHPQKSDLCGIDLQGLLRKDKLGEARESLKKWFQIGRPDEKRLIFVPVQEHNEWFLLLADRLHKRVWIVDTRKN